MNIFINRIVLPGFIVGMLGITTSALADWGGDHDCGPGTKHGRGDMTQMRERHQTELHDKLKLSADQEKAWHTFVAKGKELRPTGRPDRKEMEGLNSPQRMEKMLAQGRDREQRMEKMLASLKDFYAVLTPDQQKIFDDNMPGKRRHHKGDDRNDDWKQG